MAEPIKFRQAKKRQERAKKRAQGEENAVKFGETKAQRQARERDAARARAQLDAHRRETE